MRMTNKTLRCRALGLAAVASLGLGGCQGGRDNQAQQSPAPATTLAPVAEETSLVRLIHAIPGGAPADVYADEQMVFSAIGYKTVTEYEHVQDNQVTFKLRTAGQPGEALAENRELLADGRRYTVVALPGERGTAGELKVLTDEKDAPADGKARVRVVNAASDAGELQVMLEGREAPLVGGLEAADDMGYRDVEPISGTIRIHDKDKKRLVAESPGADFAAGKSYTMVIVGRVAGKPKAEILLVEDGREGEPRRAAALLH